MTAPYTPNLMDIARERIQVRDGGFDGLHAEAKAALAGAGDGLRGIRDRYRAACQDETARWQALRDRLDVLEHGRDQDGSGPPPAGDRLADDAVVRDLRADVEELATSMGRHAAELNRFELVQRTIESAWLHLERGEGAWNTGDAEAPLPPDVAFRIVEAQEGERSRLAQEVHDGPAQVLTNAIFQVEYIERVMEHDIRLARTELGFLRQLLRRELGDVRTFISQLRPRVLDQMGLDGSIRETVGNMTALTGLPVAVDLQAPGSRLNDAEQTVVLRIVQEALQNVRKHASASQASVANRLEENAWVLEIRDDGRGFDVDSVAVKGRRNFGLQFMRERAELVGARFEVRSGPGDGTVVRLAIPLREETR
jgi:two-component system sensor histidine kinase DegS